MKKKPLSFLIFFCILMFVVICRTNDSASAGETVKEVSYTTQSYELNGYNDATITPDLSYIEDWLDDTNKYNVSISITPIYDNVSILFSNADYEMDTITITYSQKLKQLNKKASVIYFDEDEAFSPVYDDDGLVGSFSKTISNLSAWDLTNRNITFTPPDVYDIPSSATGLDSSCEVLSVEYSVRFQVTAKVSLKSGSSLNVKLAHKSFSGHIFDYIYFSEIVENQKGKYELVKVKSSDSSIASVSTSSKKILLNKTGSCTITVTNGYGKSASFKVTVKPSSISRLSSSVTCSVGAEMNLATLSSGGVLVQGAPNYKVKSSNSKIVSVSLSGYHPIIYGKKTGSATLTFTSGSKKFSIKVKVTKARVVLASSITMKKGDSRTISANECSDGIYIKKVTSINGLLSVKISSNKRSVTLKANQSFSGTSVSEKVIVTFTNGKRKTIKVKITQPKPVKKFSLSDVKVKLLRSYWDYSRNKSCLKFTVTNKSSKKLKKLKIYYIGTLNEEVDGYINLNTSIAKGKSKTFTVRLDWFDFLDDVSMKVVSAS